MPKLGCSITDEEGEGNFEDQAQVPTTVNI